EARRRQTEDEPPPAPRERRTATDDRIPGLVRFRSRRPRYAPRVPTAGAVGPARPDRPRRGDPRRLGGGPGERLRPGAPERAHHQVLRRPRAGEPARGPGHRGGLLVPPPAPGAGHQAAP